MLIRAICTDIINWPLAGMILLGALGTTACDPREIKDIIGEEQGGQSSPPSSGNAGGGGTAPSSTCAATLCLEGTHCEEQSAQCIKTPCPAQAVCVKNPVTVACGGIAARPCPGSGKCVDDPTDNCDPSAGGADCGGICQCVQNVACIKGATFDPSPSVCACVIPPPPPPPPQVTCGGLAGTACPGGGKCVDDPSDSCDPAKGGADCGGVCQCIQTVLCVKDAVFDSSPKVCACVPKAAPPPVCGPVCDIYCEFGHVLDANGCPTCGCNPASAAPSCLVEKCPGVGPKSPTFQCPDGKTTAGPSCRLTAAGTCAWTVITCPT